MKRAHMQGLMGAVAGLLALGAIVSASQTEPPKVTESATAETQVHKRLVEIQQAAEALDAEKLFGFVLENDQGALIQNGKLFLTRSETLESTRQGFERLQKVSYKMDQEHITLLSPTVGLAVAAGSSTATTRDGNTFTTPFLQSVVLVLTNGGWKVFHSHRSIPRE